MLIKPLVTFDAPADGGSGGGAAPDHLGTTLAAAALDAATDAPVTTAPVTAETPADPFADLGGRQYVEDAIAIASGLHTAEGQKAIASSALQRLGYTTDEVKSFMERQAAAEAVNPLGDLADDDVLTVADVKKLLESTIEAKLAPFQQSVDEQRASQAAQAVDETFAQLGVAAGTEEQRLVLIAAQQFLHPDDWDPAHVKSAIQRGHAAVVAMVEKSREQYLNGKLTTTETLPTNIGGTAGGVGGTPVAEPKDLQEAMRRVRENAKSW